MDSMKYPDLTPLNEQQEHFCQAFVETGAARNRLAAYRAAYHPGPDVTTRQVINSAYQVFHTGNVQRRIQELLDLAAAETIIKARDLLQDWVDIATTDPNEIVSVQQVNCRHCNGLDFAYQWSVESEYQEALDAFQSLSDGARTAKAHPECLGGFGFDGLASPRRDCPHCFGVGETRVIQKDTTKLSPRARKLYKGVKLTAQGPQVEMHDQEAARVNIAKMLGAFAVEGKGVAGITPAAAVQKDMQPEDAAQRYLRLVSG